MSWRSETAAIWYVKKSNSWGIGPIGKFNFQFKISPPDGKNLSQLNLWLIYPSWALPRMKGVSRKKND